MRILTTLAQMNKRMKRFWRFLLTAILLVGTLEINAQTSDSYTLTVCGDGSSLQEATDNALRNAVGQAYGVYVSSDLTILNDAIVKDEIGTLASGNILSYDVLSHTATPQGQHMVTVKTTVSVSNLISFSKAKGSKVEFAGSLFGANLRLIESAKKNERIVIEHFIKQVEIFLDNCGPFTTPKILESSPKKNSDGTYHIELKMRDVQTDVPGKLYTMLCDFLNSIALTDAEIEMYRQLDESPFSVRCSMNKTYSSPSTGISIKLRTNRINRLADILDSAKDISTGIAKDAEGNVIAKDKETYRRAYGRRNVSTEWSQSSCSFYFSYWWKMVDGTLTTKNFYNDSGSHYYTNFAPQGGNGTTGLTMDQVSRIASIEMKYELVYQKLK